MWDSIIFILQAAWGLLLLLFAGFWLWLKYDRLSRRGRRSVYGFRDEDDAPPRRDA